ncbi:zinc finger, CCHC-type containing protein [Tanacetum coccineum]
MLLGGHRDHLLAFLAHILYCILAEQQYNLAYFFVKRIESARATSKAHFPYDPEVSVGKAQSLRSPQRSAHHNLGSSSHQEDDDEDDGASRASTPSPTTYLNSLKPLNYQQYEIPSPSKQSNDLLFERQTELLNQSQDIHKEDDDVTWWVDSGETVHVCKDICWFKTYESLKDGSILHMGMSQQPGKNLVSSSVLNNCGYKQVIESNKFVLSKHAFMSTSKLNDSILWHARLVHVHFKRMQDMSKDGLILSFDMDTENDLCDMHATPSLRNKKYFVTFIDDASRTETRVLGEVVSLPDPKLKTLGERGIKCIFVGCAEHSKAFRFFVIEPNESVSVNSIIESRDAIFDENIFSSVPRPSLGIPNGTEDIGGLVVPEEVTEEVVTQQPEPKLRKSKWNRTPKNFGPEFQLYLIEGRRDKDVAFWKEAINDEMDSIMGNNTWVLADLPQGCKWIFKRKLKSDYSLDGCEDNNVAKIVLKKFNYFDSTLINTPMDTSEKLMPNNGQTVSQLEYSKVIGCLMYTMTCTSPDIAFDVGKLIRYISNPGTQYWQAIQGVLKYLKKTMDYRLTYTGYASVLKGYTDVSWIINTRENSSTSGWVFLLGGSVISWASKKQTCITGSTMKSEFVALAAAGKEAKWLRNLILEIPLWSKPISPISIHCDSVATLAKAYSQMYNEKSRHLGVRHSMIRELITNRVISIKFMWSQQNFADHLTKGLARDLVIKSAKGMGLKSN